MSKINKTIRFICFDSIFDIRGQSQIIISPLMVFIEIFLNLFFRIPTRNILDH